MNSYDSTNSDYRDTVAEKQRFLSFFQVCGGASIVGIAAAVLTDLIGAWVVNGYSLISQSISSLAVGRYAWIQDTGLFLLALGTMILALGLARWRYRHGKWLLGAFALFLIGIDIFVIACFNQYAGQENRGADIHIKAVYALGILFALGTFLIGLSLRSFSKAWAAFSMGLGALWVLTAPFFFFVPSGWFGLYERGLGLVLISWIMGMSCLLWSQRREQRKPSRADELQEPS